VLFHGESEMPKKPSMEHRLEHAAGAGTKITLKRTVHARQEIKCCGR
jgi:hypothetical protein